MELFLAHSSWTKWKRLPAECRWWSLRSTSMQGSDLDVFDVRLEQQMPARWQVGWNVLRSLAPQHQRDHKVRTVWSSTPGGRFQKALPAAPQPRSLCWIIKSLGRLKLKLLHFFQRFINNNAEGCAVGQSPLFVDCYQTAESEEMFYISYVFIPCMPTAEGLQIQMFPTNKCLYLKIVFNKCHRKVNKTKPHTCGWVTDNEPNKINWEPIKTNTGCCELYLLAIERARRGK